MSTRTTILSSFFQNGFLSGLLRKWVGIMLMLFLAGFLNGVSAQTGTPDIEVQHWSIPISNGDMTPSTDDGTDFGSVEIGDNSPKLFDVCNTGNAYLRIDRPFVQISGPNASDFYFHLYANYIAPGACTELDACFIPRGPGLRTALVTICSNDPDENPYTFAIQGTGIAVGDNEPPVIVTEPDPISLWPPNHKYKTITLAQCVASVSDNCTNLSIDDVLISQVTSDEPENAQGGGDGNTKNDIVIAPDCQSVKLRSERNGSGNGRVYTIHFSVADEAGNVGTATYLVTVPHSRNGDPAVDDGPVYVVNSNCGGLSKTSDDYDLATEISLPEGYALKQNYPNPFNPDTEIRFSIPEPNAVTLQVFNSTGQLVRTLVSNNMAAGHHKVVWNATDDFGRRVSSGVYIYLLRAGSFTAQHKLVLMK